MKCDKFNKSVLYSVVFMFLMGQGLVVSNAFAETAITNKTLAIIVNDRDPDSVAVAKYYQQNLDSVFAAENRYAREF